jgi:hypothetical protein
MVYSSHFASIAQLVEQLFRKQQVKGSSPFAGSTVFRHCKATNASRFIVLMRRFLLFANTFAGSYNAPVGRYRS